MKISKLFVVAIIVSCVSLQMNGMSEWEIDLMKSGGDVMPPAGDIMPFDHFLDQASKKINELKKYIKKEHNRISASKFASEEGRRAALKGITAHIKKEIEKIRVELNSAKQSGAFFG